MTACGTSCRSLRRTDAAGVEGRADIERTLSIRTSATACTASIPQLLAREPRALDQRLELRPHDGRMHAAIERALRKAAVGADHHVLAPEQIGETQRPLG